MTHSHSKLVAVFFSGLMFLSISTGIAQAQGALTFQGDDGWTLHAAVDGGQVVGFLATHNPLTIPEGSYANVWFERQSDNSFTAAGNVSDTPTAVAKRIELNKSAALFGQAELNDPSDPIATTLNSFYVGPFNVTLDPLNKGLAEDDPFQDIIDLLSPEEMELVVELGGHGAVSLSAMAIAVNTCQSDQTDGTSAHGVSLLESRLASLADQFNMFLALSEDDWIEAESDSTVLAGILDWIPCCWPGIRVISTSHHWTNCLGFVQYIGGGMCTDYCDTYDLVCTARVNFDCTSGPMTYTRTNLQYRKLVTFPCH